MTPTVQEASRMFAAEALGPGRATRRRRETGVIVGLGTLAVTLSVLSLINGAFAIVPGDFLAALLGQGEGGAGFVLWRLRIPRLLLGILAGVAFALAGGLFQTLLRNPLASPDILGISGGASAAAAFGILVLGISGAAVSVLAFGGAMVVALAIYVLAWRGGVSGYRFVLIGVGFAFLANAVIGYLVTRGDVREVQQALVWTVGGLGGADWSELRVLAPLLAVLVAATALSVPRLRIMQLGDESAGGLGVSIQATRVLVLILAVALAAIATAFTGPIVFVAFVSAPIARRLVGTGSLALTATAFTGIVIVLLADLAPQVLLPQAQVPIGIVTGIIGAPYLLWLLASRRAGVTG